MNQQEIKKTITGLLKKIAPDTEPESLGPADNIRRELGIDSFDYLQFIMAINDRFGIEIPEEDYGKIETIDSILSYIQDKAVSDF